MLVKVSLCARSTRRLFAHRVGRVAPRGDDCRLGRTQDDAGWRRAVKARHQLHGALDQRAAIQREAIVRRIAQQRRRHGPQSAAAPRSRATCRLSRPRTRSCSGLASASSYSSIALTRCRRPAEHHAQIELSRSEKACFCSMLDVEAKGGGETSNAGLGVSLRRCWCCSRERSTIEDVVAQL